MTKREVVLLIVLAAAASVGVAVEVFGRYSTAENRVLDDEIEFEAKDIKRTGLYDPYYWTEMNERSTSKNYTLWEKSDVYLIDWPGKVTSRHMGSNSKAKIGALFYFLGNITVRDEKWPLLKWKKPRAKFLVNRCCERFVGIEMRAYGYRYVYLTWGSFRFLNTYAGPLTIPADVLKKKDKLYDLRHSMNPTEVVVDDFAFVHDALLLTMEEDQVVMRVYGLEMTYVKSGSWDPPLEPLKYALANGISSPVNKLVTQYCCIRMDDGMCPHGETVVAYREYSEDYMIYVSLDGGENFKLLKPKLPSGSLIHSVLSYPDRGMILILHGTQTMAVLELFSITTGISLAASSNKTFISGVTGVLQASRIGEQMSLIIWDDCHVWYSPETGKLLSKAIFYHNGYFRHGQRSKKHYILPSYCKFGMNSSLTFSDTGRLALLDSDNNFHMGVDTKTSILQLVTMKVDFSLILERHAMSLVPHFDHSQHPKYLYPPRYLEVPDKALLGKNYSQRLGIRLVPKTVFPTEFITVFYEENAWLPKRFQWLAMGPCLTSSIKVNNSVTQKAKYYTFKPQEQLTFPIRFKSRINTTSRQLHYEPKDVNKFILLEMRLVSIVIAEPEDSQHWYTYDILIRCRNTVKSQTTFLVNFFTWKGHRCNIQPSTAVYIKIDENPPDHVDPVVTDEELSKRSFAKLDSQQTLYGRTYDAKTGECEKRSHANFKSVGKMMQSEL